MFSYIVDGNQNHNKKLSIELYNIFFNRTILIFNKSHIRLKSSPLKFKSSPIKIRLVDSCVVQYSSFSLVSLNDDDSNYQVGLRDTRSDAVAEEVSK